MNILFLSNNSVYFDTFFGGIETSMSLLAGHLVRRGHNVYYITRKPAEGFETGIKKLEAEGVKVRAVVQSFANIPLVPRIYFELEKIYIGSIIKRHKISIVYCSYSLNNLRILLKLREKGLDFKIVMRMAGMLWYEQSKNDIKIRDAFERVFNEIDAVNYNHAGLHGIVEKGLNDLGMKVNFKKSFTADIGTIAPFGRPEDYADLRNDAFTIIMATRFSDYQKRHDLLVKAVSRLEPQFPVKVLLIGSGDKRKEIESLIERLDLSDKIHIEPFVEQRRLWAKMLGADLLCHACEYEGLSKIIIESMAMGLPVLASNVPPVNEYVKDGENGFLAYNDPGVWASRIKELAGSRDMLCDVSRKSIEHARVNYDPEKNVILFEKYFKEFAGAR